MFKPPRPLVLLAWLNVILHAVALVLAYVAIRPGSPLVSLPERLVYLLSRPLGWSLAWFSWMCCAAALVAFVAVLAHRLRSPLAQFALIVTVVAAAFDLLCDTIYFVFPELVMQQRHDVAVFVAVERIAGIGSMTIANGGYSLAVLLLNVELHRRGFRGWLVGYAVAGFGFLLAAAGFTGVAWHAEWATPPTIGLFCLWAVLVVRWGERGALAP